MTVETFVNVTESDSPRNTQPLPQLHFVVTDDWIGKLGEKSFCFWLKLFTMVDRTDKDKSKHCIKTRTSKLLKKLDMSKSTYLRLIKPLYEYGLVDLIEYEDSTNKGSKPVNIVVHRFPQNNYNLNVQPLEKCREWEQRIDEKYNFSKQGGRPKKEDKPEEEPEITLPEAIEEIVEEETPAEQPEETGTDFNTDVNTIIKTEFDLFENGMKENNVDLEVVRKWVNKNAGVLPYSHFCFVFKQLATYPETIMKTGSFITSTLKQVPSFYRPVTEPAPTKEETTFTSKIPFYNWLEKDGNEPINDDDMPY